jgi:trk system potassium uptake protein TrkH
MNPRRLFHVVGPVVGAAGVAMLSATVVALIYREWSEAALIAVAALLTGLGGFIAWWYIGVRGELTTREGFAVVGLSWFAISLFGTLPYLLTGEIGNLTDAFFETAAGFSTTGSSVVADPATLSHGILWWRSLTQWMGGMGIIVLSVAILPLLGVGAVELARAESPGPVPDRLTPRFRETAKRLWFLYLAITVTQMVLLLLGEMTLFEAAAHALTTMSTGGFSTDVGSMGAFSAYSQWIVIGFMLIAGASFTLHVRGLKSPKRYWESSEFRLYTTIVAVATIVMAIGTWGGEIHQVVRDAMFTAVSMITTTGYGTADYGLWPVALQLGVLGLMFVGGMAGSTGGSVKPYRLGVLVSASRADLRRVIHPRGVFPVRLGKERVDPVIVESVQSFFLLYMFIFMTGSILLAIINDMTGSGLNLVTSISATASALGNIGPGLDAVGPTANYIGIPGAGKWLLSVLMLVGRLEIFPIILLFTPELWRK